MNDDILDDYVTTPRMHGTLTPEYIYENSGHRLLCGNCKTFRRTSAEWTGSDPMLRITCKTCGSYEDFVVTETGLIPKKFADLTRKFSMKRARQILGGKKDAGKS